VVAGLGDGDWLRNLAAVGPAAATVGRTTGPVVARRLSVAEAAAVTRTCEEVRRTAEPG